MKKKIIFKVLLILGAFFLLNLDKVSASSLVPFLVVAEECSDIIDAEVYAFLQQIFNIIKFAGPLLCLALSISDFVKAAASQDKDALVKAAKTTMKRVIYALILFFIPTLIDFLFPLFGWVGTCGIGTE